MQVSEFSFSRAAVVCKILKAVVLVACLFSLLLSH